jgi:HAD superfamily hydrolase (TIGR01509 family)
VGERPRLEAVLLDAGGTLVRLDFEWMAEEVTRMGGSLDAATLRRAEIEGRRRYDASRGHATPPGEAPAPLGAVGRIDAYFGGMLDAAGVPPALIAPAVERFHARHAECGLWTRPMEGAREALDALAALGLRLAVVSNSDGRAEMHLKDCDVHRGLEFVVDSHVVGVEKPDPAIFRVALDRMGLPASASVFVGDIRSVDEAGAGAAGTGFVLLDPSGAYASPGTEFIAGIHELPDWITARYQPPSPGRTESTRS